MIQDGVESLLDENVPRMQSGAALLSVQQEGAQAAGLIRQLQQVLARANVKSKYKW